MGTSDHQITVFEAINKIKAEKMTDEELITFEKAIKEEKKQRGIGGRYGGDEHYKSGRDDYMTPSDIFEPLLELFQKDKFDIILMNPPYGGNEKDSIKINFPADLQCSETADLFMAVIMYRLRENGRAAVVLPDGFMFGTDGAKLALKKKLFSEFNVHTIVRMPHSVFAPYTSITTNILFFEKTGATKHTWFYRLDMPEGYKNFSKTKPMKLEHFNPAISWWSNREDINIDGFDKAKKFTIAELEAQNFNIDLCGYPHEEEVILPPDQLIQQYQEKRASLNSDIDKILGDISKILGIKA